MKKWRSYPEYKPSGIEWLREKVRGIGEECYNFIAVPIFTVIRANVQIS